MSCVKYGCSYLRKSYFSVKQIKTQEVVRKTGLESRLELVAPWAKWRNKGVCRKTLLEAGKHLAFGIPEIPWEKEIKNKKQLGMRAVRVLIRTIFREEWSQPFCRNAGCGGICLMQLLWLPRWAQHLPLALPGCSCSRAAFCHPPRGPQLSHRALTSPRLQNPRNGDSWEDSWWCAHVIWRHGHVSAHHRALVACMYKLPPLPAVFFF